MTGRGLRPAAAATALALLAGPLVGACSRASDFQTVEDEPANRSVALPTSTIVQGTLPSPTAAPAAVPTATDAALTSVVGRLAADPGAIASVGRLAEADPAMIAEFFGLDAGVVQQLGLTLSDVQGLAAILAGADPATIAASVAPLLDGSVDMSALHALLDLAGRLDATAIALVDGLTQQVLQAVVGTVGEALSRVDPTLMAVLSALLARLDPGGLGAVAADPANAAVLGVFTGAALRANPGLDDALRPQLASEPELVRLLDHLVAVGDRLDTQVAASLTSMASRLDPDVLAALTRLVHLSEDPSTQDLLGRLAG